MAERFKALAWRASVLETVPWVQIPVLPQKNVFGFDLRVSKSSRTPHSGVAGQIPVLPQKNVLNTSKLQSC